mgnify:CR=1 FL=1
MSEENWFENNPVGVQDGIKFKYLHSYFNLN